MKELCIIYNLDVDRVVDEWLVFFKVRKDILIFLENLDLFDREVR